MVKIKLLIHIIYNLHSCHGNDRHDKRYAIQYRCNTTCMLWHFYWPVSNYTFQLNNYESSTWQNVNIMVADLIFFHVYIHTAMAFLGTVRLPYSLKFLLSQLFYNNYFSKKHL